MPIIISGYYLEINSEFSSVSIYFLCVLSCVFFHLVEAILHMSGFNVLRHAFAIGFDRTGPKQSIRSMVLCRNDPSLDRCCPVLEQQRILEGFSALPGDFPVAFLQTVARSHVHYQ